MFSNPDLAAGELINTAGNIQYVSGSETRMSYSFRSFSTPEPGAGLPAIAIIGKRSKMKA